MSYPTITTYPEACQAVAHLGILPLSATIPDHPSLADITARDAWHTSTETDPWRWRNRFATEGIAAYGRFIGSKPWLVAREVFPLVHCILAGSSSVEERYRAGAMARPATQLYAIIQQQEIIDVRELRKQSGMQGRDDKADFDRALIDLQNLTAIVMSGTAPHHNAEGSRSGWDGTCYMLADAWMRQHGIAATQSTPTEAHAQLLSWLTPRWEEGALAYVRKKLALRS